MPARSTASTKADALPSMTGTSGPSTSMAALSTPSALKAAIRCSTVATYAPGDADGGAQLGRADVTEIGRDGVGAAVAVGQPEGHAAAGRRRMHGHGRLAPAMDPDT